MLNITNKREDTVATLSLEGRLDTTTAPQLEAELKTILADANAICFDFEKLEYISSAGLRVLLAVHKQMKTKGGMELCHVNEAIMEVFDVTGFTDFLTIK